MLNNSLNVNKIIGTNISVDDIAIIRNIFENHVHTPYKDIGPDAVCIKQQDTHMNDRRSCDKIIIYCINTNSNNNRENTANIVDDYFKVLCMFKELPELHIEHYDDTECCIACSCNYQRMFTN